ncbi:hypothetical protein KXW50_000578 [Aspergillus fumigatus]|nr:hypothetical protein KXX28_000609 [Aspergillus fumigatus]KAH2164188.1 hypothetical protein KXW33_000090 [Aspergillus fumigatus]KAH2232612.1 hypothetical protein KXV37_007944 [Aspergillus fumigatus]KAH2338332.1 hypothetical protein KXW87_005176 [Aspergillus fumigatus]KAH2717508.1 hypothetical protein KXW03_007167 [Aspergillus fumigatus]
MFIFSAAPVPVGSSIFFALALLAISVSVLLLLRRFLTLRATPAYLSVPVFLALALPASVVLLVPIDLASSSRDGGGPKAIWLPDRLILVAWRITYWLIFVLTWAILPLLGEYIDSGYRDTKSRILYSLRSNARYQLIVLCCAFVGLIYISIQNGFRFASIKALVMALAYVWGLVLAIYAMGHGLVSIPRTLFRNANVSGRLRRVQAHAPRLHDRLMDAINDLESLESQVTQLQQRKTGTARDFQDWIEELAETSSPIESRSAILEPSNAQGTVPPVITERYMADLTRRLQRARHQKARFVDEWDRLVLLAADLQAIIDSSASRKLDFGQSPRRSTSLPHIKFLTPYMRYHLYVNIIPSLRLVLGALCAIASACIIWSELVKSLAPRLSVVTLSIVSYHKDPKPVDFGRQLAASAWLLYMCAAALGGVNDAKVWGNRALVRRNTYGESACWYASLVARLTVPIAYNFLTFLPLSVRQNTIFYHFLGRLIDLTPLGKGFDYFFPVFILLPVFATLFNLYGRIKNVCGLGLIEEDDNELESNPSGYGLGGWREGRELIDRELNGLGSLAPSSRIGQSTWRSSRNTDTSGLRSSRTPRADSARPTRPPRGPPASSAILQDEAYEENFFQSFAHRVRNTFETATKPHWIQGEPFRLPRWMSNDRAQGSNGLTRLFGGRPADGPSFHDLTSFNDTFLRFSLDARSMNLHPLHITQSSVGERCASYITAISDTLAQRIISPLLSSKASSSLRTLNLQPDWALAPADPPTAALTVFACAIALVAMSWRFSDLWRRSPYPAAKTTPTHISDGDYTYLTPEDIVDRPSGYAGAEEDEPDTLLLKHRKNTYALHFPAYAINDGALSVGELRRRAAEVTRTPNPARIKLLYKGKLLDDDSVPCRAEGLKQQSEVLCVVSEVQPGESTPSEGSEAEAGAEKADEAPRLDEVQSGGERRKRNRNRNKKKKGKGRIKTADAAADDADGLAPPAEPPRPSSAGGSSSLPAPSPNLKVLRTPLEQANALITYLRTELLPLCEAYVAHPPTDPKARDFEHKKLSETILAQVILKADGIEPDGDEIARNARKALVKEAQAALNRLDQAARE